MGDRDVPYTTLGGLVETAKLFRVLLSAVAALVVSLWKVDEALVRVEILEFNALKVFGRVFLSRGCL